jgi:hypothetical protein
MDRKRINCGLYVSIALHVIIMMIPVTMRLARESDEIAFVLKEITISLWTKGPDGI